MERSEGRAPDLVGGSYRFIFLIEFRHGISPTSLAAEIKKKPIVRLDRLQTVRLPLLLLRHRKHGQ